MLSQCRVQGVQLGALPSAPRASVDPDVPWGVIRAQRTTRAQGLEGVLPADALQYDVIFDLFRADKRFWQQWRVVDCARVGPEEHVHSIRLVLDLPEVPEGFPRAYGANSGGSSPSSEAARKRQLLPRGYSVPLDVVSLPEGRALLASQRDLRGEVESRFEWLEDIIRRLDQPDANQGGRPAARCKQKAARSRPGAAQGLAHSGPASTVLDECRLVDEFSARLTVTNSGAATRDHRSREEEDLECDLHAFRARASQGAAPNGVLYREV